MFDSVLWTMLEPALGILAACLPTMRSLMLSLTTTPIFQKITSYFTSSRSTGGSWNDKDESGLVENQFLGGTAMHMANGAKRGRNEGGSMRELKTSAGEQTTDGSGDGETEGIHSNAGLQHLCPLEHNQYDPYEVCHECVARLQVREMGMC